MPSTPYNTVDGVAVPGVVSIPVNYPLAGITGNIDILTDYVVPFSFQPLALRAAVTTVASTASKLATIGLSVGPTGSAVAVPGASIALTTATVTPLGKIFIANATPATPTAPAVTYPAGTKINLKATGVTAFVEGSMSFIIDLRNMDET